MKNKKGFTLIELLAVIVIMGILLFVAVPAIGKIIENVRKDQYINLAKAYSNSVRHLWESDQLYVTVDDKTPSSVNYGDYYVVIDSNNNNLLDKDSKSPWGKKRVKGYVKIRHREDKDEFLVALSDGTHCIREKISDKLKRKDVIACTKHDNSKIDNKDKGGVETGNVETGENKPLGDEVLITGTGEDPGDEIKTKEGNFYIISRNENETVLLAKYNLYIGNSFKNGKMNPYANPTGIQNSNMIGYRDKNLSSEGVTNLCKKPYYQKILVTPYLNNYQKKLKSLGYNVKEVRLLNKDDLKKLGCTLSTWGEMSCKEAREFLFETSNWTQISLITPFMSNSDFYLTFTHGVKEATYGSCVDGTKFGIRPVVVIKNK